MSFDREAFNEMIFENLIYQIPRAETDIVLKDLLRWLFYKIEGSGYYLNCFLNLSSFRFKYYTEKEKYLEVWQFTICPYKVTEKKIDTEIENVLRIVRERILK